MNDHIRHIPDAALSLILALKLAGNVQFNTSVGQASLSRWAREGIKKDDGFFWRIDNSQS